MAENILFLGLDVHKKSISVATVDGSARAEVRFYGTIENTPDAVRVLCKKLCKDGRQLHACYEAGPCGYGSGANGSMRSAMLAAELAEGRQWAS